ncbi:ABC transporter substrate-binding protein [Aureibacillus halotolerans]|uniref:Carbohydrate ABC transporter substrate-binding protein (CUT1 family) n=1 Tax=Aureibacillus halotolerans TaxID=1508390 RepID=A0A4R6U645_9BACI|nr:extracellular solute-binding protein [Aureibacillus halotolerans]TDQ41236.1 carbohydrate ABC transporter substrate-binding protein (CUT1 family) [Aureibacillus halotolerans]
MMMRVLLLLSVVFVMFVTGCSSNQTSNPDAEVVRVALAGRALEDGIDPITGAETIGLNTFLEESFYPNHPDIRLELTTVPWENARAKINSMLQSGDVDVIYTGGAFASVYYQDGLIRGLNDLIEGDETFDPAAYLDGAWNESYSTKSFDQQTQFGIPAVLGRRMTVYDKTLFDQWDVEYLSENPTPEEILEKASQMTGTNPVTGEENYGLWYSGNALNGSTFVALAHYFGAQGAEGTLDNLGEINWNLNSPQIVDILSWMEEAVPYMPPAFINGGGNENFGTENNNVAIVLDGTGATATSHYRETGETTMIDRFIPVMNLGPNGEGWVAVDPYIMAKDAQNVEASWEVLKFLAGKEAQEYGYENFMLTPTLSEADFVLENDTYTQKAMEIAEISKTLLLDEANPFFASDIVPAINTFLSNAYNGNAPNKEAFLTDLQQRAENWSNNQ